MEDYLIVIPYLASAAQGNELEYALAGWKKHFKEKHKIVLVGENLPKRNDVICVESKRVNDIPGQYRQHLDYVSCFKKVHKIFPNTTGFIMVADDCYAVNDFDISEVKLLKMLEPTFFFDENSKNEWRRDKMKTKKVLLSEGYPTRNFTTHLPQWYDWDKVEALWDKYDMCHNSYTIEDLYYNIYFKDRIPFRLNKETDNLKLGIYEANFPIDKLENAFKSKIWITNSPVGWSSDLDRLLKEHYN